MPEHLRSFVVITVLMALAYAISRRLFAHALAPRFVDRLFAAGYGATAIMFFAHNMWLFLAGLAGLTLLVARRLGQPLALFVFLLLLMPGFSVQVPGFGLINYLIDLNPQRILALVLLLPAAIHLAGRPGLPRLGKPLADKVVIVFTVYTTILAYVHYDTFTGALRHLATFTLDFVLLYFVASRALLGKGAVRHVMVALVMAAIFLALVGGYEFAKKWALYASVKDVFLGETYGGYLMRGGLMRASATTGGPIVLGFVMMVAMLLSVYVQRLVPPGSARILLWLIMGMGLIAAMSRGPWVGAAVGLGVIALASANPLGNLTKLMSAAFAAAFLLLLLPGGEKIINYLPWVGEIDASSVTFRELLWRQSLLVVDRNLWLGSIDFMYATEFDDLRTGSGFIDFVNTYIGILLSYGLLGFGLYVMLILLSIFPNLVKSRRIKIINPEFCIYIITLLGIQIAIIITIWMVSSVSLIYPLTTLILSAGVSHSWLTKFNS